MSDIRVTPRPWLWKPRTKPIRMIEIHATRGNTTPANQKPAALNWVQSPNNYGALGSSGRPEWGSSFSHVIGTDGSEGTVLDDDQMPTYSAGYGGYGSEWALDEYAISYELAQSQALEPFADAIYRRVAQEIAIDCKIHGIPPVFIEVYDQRGAVPTGLVRHDRCENGTKLGKTDPGPQFDEARLIVLIEVEMRPPEPEPPPEPESPAEPEPEPPLKEVSDVVIVIVKGAGSGTQYVLNPDGRKYVLGSLAHRSALNRLAAAGAIRIEYREIPDADIEAIPDEHA